MSKKTLLYSLLAYLNRGLLDCSCIQAKTIETKRLSLKKQQELIMKEAEECTDRVKPETRLYSIRWLIISMISVVSLAVRILRGSIGVVNNIYAAYFNLSYSAVDWFTLIQIPGLIVANVVLAIMIYFKVVQFRKLSITMAAGLTMSCCCFLIAYVYPITFYLLFIAGFFSGFIHVGVDVISALYSVTWFPESQIGFALSMKEIGGSVGSLLAFLLPSVVLLPPTDNSTLMNYSDSNSNQNQYHDDWFPTDKLRFIAISAILLVIAIFVLISFIAYSADKPDLPPSIAQKHARVEKHDNTEDLKLTFKNFKDFLWECHRIMSNKINIQVVVFDGVILGSNFIHKMLMGEIFRNLFLKLSYKSQSNAMAGYILMLYEIGCLFGNTISGKLCDYFKRYTLQIKICIFLCFVSIVSVFISYEFKSYEAIMVFETLYGIFLATSYTPIIESLFQHMYPTNTGFLILINGIMSYVVAIIINLLGQFILRHYGEASVIIYTSALWFLSFVVSLFFRPDLVRLNIERSQTNSRSEKLRSVAEGEELLQDHE